MNFIFILWALVVGFWLGVWATHYNFVKPLHEVEGKLRKELGEVRTDLLQKERILVNLGRQVSGSVEPDPIENCQCKAYCRGRNTDPTIEHRAPSDVFFFKSFEDLL